MDQLHPVTGMRRCLVLPLNRKPEGARKAVFHQFAQSSDDHGDHGPAPMPVAIVEYDNGELESVYVNRVQFLDRAQ